MHNNCSDTLTASVWTVKDFLQTLSIGNRLAKVRAESRLSSRDFADAIKEAGYSVSYGSVLEYEAEDANPPANYVTAVGKRFDKNLTWLLTGMGVEDGFGPSEAESILAAVRNAMQVPTTAFYPAPDTRQKQDDQDNGKDKKRA